MLAPTGSRLVERLTPDFNEAEDKALRLVRGRSGWQHPETPAERHAAAVKDEAAYVHRSISQANLISYIKAVTACDPVKETITQAGDVFSVAGSSTMTGVPIGRRMTSRRESPTAIATERSTCCRSGAFT